MWISIAGRARGRHRDEQRDDRAARAEALTGPAVAVLLASLAMAGCGATDSDNVRTGGVRADLLVEAKGTAEARVTATFTVGSGGIGTTQLELRSGDRATARAKGIEKRLQKDTDLIGGITYNTRFEFDDPETLFTIALERPADTSAPDSNVRLPQPFEIDSPLADETLFADDRLRLRWSPSGYEPSVELTFTTRCPAGSPAVTLVERRSSNDDGSFEAGLRSLTGRATSGQPPGTRCALEIEMMRSRRGQLDPNYGEGGRIVARQTRTRRVDVLTR